MFHAPCSTVHSTFLRMAALCRSGSYKILTVPQEETEYAIGRVLSLW